MRRRTVTTRSLLTGGFVLALLGAGVLLHPVPSESLTASSLAAPGADGNWSAEAFADLEPPAVLTQTRGERLLSQAVTLLGEARSVRMTVDITQHGKRAQADLRMDRAGNCTGTMDGGPGASGDLIVLAEGAKDDGPEVYMSYSDRALAEWQAMADTRGPAVSQRIRERLALVRGKYVHVPAGPKGADALAKVCTMGQVLGAQAADTSGTRDLPEERRDGRRVIPLLPPQGDEDLGSAYVDAAGKPYLRSLEMDSEQIKGKMRFSGYGEPLTVRRPPAAQIVELPADEGSVFEA
ncbi:hypothetical protein [Streptomyces xanthii]|uniref:Uncharacterized protein n=1 Tax=Streptomyces xanthii TaxID=2768069 RepID=A0A7H1B706_9ACTN|nr:hypothetical protein [Streptomyces xanthii]QNS04511.1 hypothetical protein IAG42_13370 [Streptomyces xanthii]